jgi:hypothetical protein
MSWVQKRADEYQRGGRMTFIERVVLAHADPFNFLLLAIGVCVAAYGLWQHDINLIVGGGAIGLIGDVISWLRK